MQEETVTDLFYIRIFVFQMDLDAFFIHFLLVAKEASGSLDGNAPDFLFLHITHL